MECITKSAFARRARVSKPMVSKLVASDGPLHAALIDGKINIDHDTVAAYLERRGKPLVADNFTPNVGGRPPEKRDHEKPEGEMPAANADVSRFEKMTLPELTQVFGTDERFKVWMTGRKHITDVRKKELELMARAGELVSRALVVSGVFEPFDSAFRRMLSDTPRAIATQVSALVKAGGSEEEVETYVRDLLSSQIKPAKQKAIRTLTLKAEGGLEVA